MELSTDQTFGVCRNCGNTMTFAAPNAAPQYPQGGYAQPSYPQNGYPQGGYDQNAYAQPQAYPQAGYDQNGYAQPQAYPQNGYAQPQAYPQYGYAQPYGGYTPAPANVPALLQRGNLSLADGNWITASAFYEEVLRHEPENGDALLGKLLASEKCQNMDAFIGLRHAYRQNVTPKAMYLEPDTAHITEMAQKYVVPGYVDQQSIQNLYNFNLAYPSEVKSRKQMLQAETAYWANHALLSQVAQFASEETAEGMANAKAALLSALESSIAHAEAAEAAARENLQQAYAQHLAQADSYAEQMYQTGLKQQADYYHSLVQGVQEANDIAVLTQIAAAFDMLGNYQDSQNQAEECRKKINELEMQLAAAREEARQLKLKKQAARRKLLKKLAIIGAIAAVIIVGIVLLLTLYILPNNQYNAAEELLVDGKYDEAIVAFEELDGYSNSQDMIAVITELQTLNTDNLDHVVKNILSKNVHVQLIYNTHSTQAMESTMYEDAAQYTGLQTPQNQGYEFEKWTVSGFRYTQDGYVSIDVEAHWSDLYNISYNLDGGTVTGNPTEYHKDGSAVTLNNPTRNGYAFIGWTGTDLAEPTLNVTIPAGSYGDRTYTANWVANGKIQYELAGGTVSNNPTEYSYLDGEITLHNPTRTGYTFTGWTGTGLTGLTMNVTIPSGSQGNRTYTANWKPNTYTFTLNANGGKVDRTTMTATYGSSYTLPTPTRQHYTFAGWYHGSTKFENSAWSQAKDVTLTAKWTPTTYKINYVMANGKHAGSNPASYTIESGTINFVGAERNGYKFLGWFSDEACTKSISSIPAGSHGDITIYAKWEAITYTITYNLNGGRMVGTEITTFTVEDLPLKLPTASKNGVSFLNWTKDSVSGQVVDTVTEPGDLNLIANYMDPQLTLTLASGGSHYIVSSYNGTATRVEIPAYYNGKPVTQIGDSAFASCLKLISVYVPDTVTKISDKAFLSCRALRDVRLSESLTEIGTQAFYNCESLITISFPRTSLVTIKSSAFAHCVALKNIALPDSVTTLGAQAFANCTGLISVTLPAGLKTLADSTFYNCGALSNITLPEGLTRIENDAFYGCKALTILVIPSSVKYISPAFTGCAYLNLFCRVAKAPSGWSSNWHCNCKVIWSYTGS